MRIYMDTSALCCEFDDLTVEANAIEASAVRHILGLTELGVWELCDSGAIQLELANDNWKLRRMAAISKLRVTRAYVRLPDVKQRGKEVLDMGFGKLDALHIACAEDLEAKWLLTID